MCSTILYNMLMMTKNEEDKKAIIQDLNTRLGADIGDMNIAYDVENELVNKRDHLQSCLNIANNEVPIKILMAIKKGEENYKQVENLKSKSDKFKAKFEGFLNKTKPLRVELDKRFNNISKLEGILIYLKSFEKIEALSNQIKQSNDDEQAVQLYGELKALCALYQKGHRGNYVKEYTLYWHNVLKDKLTKQYDDVLNLLKWPFTSGAEKPPVPKEVLMKFSNLTRYLFLIQEPEDLTVGTASEDIGQDQTPCLPVRLLLRPLKKRFAFHFTGSRQTARIDRPEWFFTQTLTWIKDHQTFVQKNVQPIADNLEMKNIRSVDEFNAGLIALAAERLHTVLGLYYAQGSRGVIPDVDAAFAHAIDETLGFHKDLVAITGTEVTTVLSVLTKAETFLKWLAVEKKYALCKMEELLGNEQWGDPAGAGVGAAVGCAVWVPRAALSFVDLLATIEKRYTLLPQPGHRLQFLELQLELVEEWRVRLSQLQHAASAELGGPPARDRDGARALVAVVNAAHHTRAVLLQWTHSLHYLQLHYYRRQFQHFTQQQHHDEESESSSSSDDDDDDDDDSDEDNVIKSPKAGETDEAMSLKEVEVRAKKLALNEVSRRISMLNEQNSYDITAPIANLAVTDPLPNDNMDDQTGVFGDAPALLAHLRDAGLASLADYILLEFKALLKDYKKQKWHAMVIMEEMALSVSPALCRPLAGLAQRLAAAAALDSPLALRLRAALAHYVDDHVLQEVVLGNWFNTGGTMQFTHDVKRNLIPAFATSNKGQTNTLPKLLDACQLLNMDYDDARRLRSTLAKQPAAALESLISQGIKHIMPNDALQILNQRTDLNDTTSPSSVMELF